MSFQELLQSIQLRPSMTELSIYHIHSKFSKDEFAFLYDAIARLPKLQKFSLWTCEAPELKVLTNFLLKAINLQTLAFQSVKLHNWKDMADFSNALLQHPALNHLCLDQVEITAPGLTLDPLLHAIGRNPHITTLRISTLADNSDTFEREMIVNADCLVRLCNNKTLEELALWGVELNDSIVETLAHSLQGNDRLQSLSLRHCGPYFTLKGQEALVNMLHGNGNLQALHMGELDLPHDLQWLLDFHLYLNKTNTRHVLLEDEDTTPGEWLEALEWHTHDISATFHLLQERGLQLFHH